MGENLKILDQMEESETYYQKSFNMAKQLYERSGKADSLSTLVISCDNLGNNKHRLGLYGEALDYRLKTLKLFERHLELDPTQQKHYAYFLDKVASSYKNMGDQLTKVGKLDEAEEYYQKYQNINNKQLT